MQLLALQIAAHLHLVADCEPGLIGCREQGHPLSDSRVLEELQAFALIPGGRPDLPQPLAAVDDVLAPDHAGTDPGQRRNEPEEPGEDAVLRISRAPRRCRRYRRPPGSGAAGICGGFHPGRSGSGRQARRTCGVPRTQRPGGWSRLRRGGQIVVLLRLEDEGERQGLRVHACPLDEPPIIRPVCEHPVRARRELHRYMQRRRLDNRTLRCLEVIHHMLAYFLCGECHASASCPSCTPWVSSLSESPM
ncbi:hypothetical protein D3C73_506140 [compost metagenome]